jgi:NAD dependent epimerase/dehydratase family enzyme
LRGTVNAVAGASTNSDFTHTLARALHRPALVLVPKFALHLLFGREMPDETILASQRVDPRRLRDLGFTFRHPDLVMAVKTALEDKEP